MHPKRVTVWCGGILGPFFSEKDQNVAITVNGDRYWAMLNEYLFTKIKEEDIGNIWFEQEGHTAEVLLDKITLSAAELMSFGHLGAVI